MGLSRGGGRPRMHYDEQGQDQRIHGHFLLTPEVNSYISQMAHKLGVGRSEVVRRLVIEASKGKAKKWL